MTHCVNNPKAYVILDAACPKKWGAVYLLAPATLFIYCILVVGVSKV